MPAHVALLRQLEVLVVQTTRTAAAKAICYLAHGWRVPQLQVELADGREDSALNRGEAVRHLHIRHHRAIRHHRPPLRGCYPAALKPPAATARVGSHTRAVIMSSKERSRPGQAA